MKILFVLDRGNLYGGVQKMMAEVAVALAEQHHDQVGVMMAYIDDDKMEAFLLSHHVRVHNLRCRKYSPLLPFRYARIIRKYRYEVVHTNHSAVSLPCWFLKQSGSSPRSIPWTVCADAMPGSGPSTVSAIVGMRVCMLCRIV